MALPIYLFYIASIGQDLGITTGGVRDIDNAYRHIGSARDKSVVWGFVM